MKFTFYKYQATGNDFVIIDNRQDLFDKNNTKLIQTLCDRRFGIGADGLMLLENADDYDFEMVYYNSDGQQSTMCGNGGRSIVQFAKFLGIVSKKASFLAIDGPHDAVINSDEIALKMSDVNEIKSNNSAFVLDTGSPHYVELHNNLDLIDMAQEGAKIRNNSLFKLKGINVNFVEQLSSNLFYVRTYERGVEAETLSCGTGVTAVALAMHKANNTSSTEVNLKTKGGSLTVRFCNSGDSYNNIWLIGPAHMVFEGVYSTESL